MVTRLIVGLLKGLVLGGLAGYGLLFLGLSGWWPVYAAAAVVGAVVSLVAGKPIWAQDARIEVGMKAVAGLVLGPLLLLAVRSFLTMPLPVDVSFLPGAAREGLTLGGFSMTSLAIVAAVIAGFYDADNQPQPKEAARPPAKQAAPPTNQRVDEALAAAGLDPIEEPEEEAQRGARRK
jgi:hypothetical protein